MPRLYFKFINEVQSFEFESPFRTSALQSTLFFKFHRVINGRNGVKGRNLRSIIMRGIVDWRSTGEADEAG